jgi:hypothetical protein
VGRSGRVESDQNRLARSPAHRHLAAPTGAGRVRRAQFRCRCGRVHLVRCGRGGPSPGADVAGPAARTGSGGCARDLRGRARGLPPRRQAQLRAQTPRGMRKRRGMTRGVAARRVPSVCAAPTLGGPTGWVGLALRGARREHKCAGLCRCKRARGSGVLSSAISEPSPPADSS